MYVPLVAKFFYKKRSGRLKMRGWWGEPHFTKISY